MFRLVTLLKTTRDQLLLAPGSLRPYFGNAPCASWAYEPTSLLTSRSRNTRQLHLIRQVTDSSRNTTPGTSRSQIWVLFELNDPCKSFIAGTNPFVIGNLDKNMSADEAITDIEHQNSSCRQLPLVDLVDLHMTAPRRLNRQKRDAFGNPRPG